MKKIILSFDVEDWFCAYNMRSLIKNSDWDECELRIYNGMFFILNELKKRDIKATFFVLGWIAEKCPQLIKAILNDGHEVASHGYGHIPVFEMNSIEFREDVQKSIEALSRAGVTNVQGFRAPSFSIGEKNLWALDVLRELGLKYDSSIYPIVHPDYGLPNFSQQISIHSDLFELPLNYLNIMSYKLPISGGGYFRLYNFNLYKKLIHLYFKNNSLLVTYFHPWEFDLNQPIVPLPVKRKIRHYIGIRNNREKFINFLDSFDFVDFQTIVNSFEHINNERVS